MVASRFQFRAASSGYLHLPRSFTAEFVIEGQGQPLVLVPGLAGGVRLLRPLIDCLKSSYRVIAYDLRGEDSGLFDRGYGFGQLVDDLDAVIRGLGLERPGLLGVSFGGAIALDYATQRSSRLSFLALQGTGIRYQPSLFGDVARQVLDRLPLPVDSPFVNQFFNLLIGGKRRPGDQFDFVVDSCWRTDQSMMAYRLGLLDGFDASDRLDHIDCPVLATVGGQDILVGEAEARELAQSAPEGRFQRLDGAGHFAFVTHPDKLAAQVLSFAHHSAAA